MRDLELLDKDKEELKERLNISSEVIEKAREIIGRLNGIGMHPKSIVGGAVYIASVLLGERRTQREVAIAVGVAAATIRNACKKIASAADIEITV